MVSPYREPPPRAPRRRRPGQAAVVLTIVAALFLSLAIPVAVACAPGLHLGDDNRIGNAPR